jgi:beta-glucosidase
VTRVLANMTTAQKARQLDLIYGNQQLLAQDGSGTLNMTAVTEFMSTGGLGVIHDLYDPTGAFINTLQALAMNATGIPIGFLEEGLHGLGQAGKTVFPQSIAMAGTWDTALMQQVAQAIAAETRAYGIVQLYAPVIGTAVDPRCVGSPRSDAWQRHLPPPPASVHRDAGGAAWKKPSARTACCRHS